MRWSHGILCTLARWTVEFSSKIVWFVLDTAGSLHLYHIHCNVVSLGKSKKILYLFLFIVYGFVCCWKIDLFFRFRFLNFFFFPFPFPIKKTKIKGLFSTTRQCSIERWHCKIRLHCCQCCNIFNSIRFEWFFFLIFGFVFSLIFFFFFSFCSVSLALYFVLFVYDEKDEHFSSIEPYMLTVLFFLASVCVVILGGKFFFSFHFRFPRLSQQYIDFFLKGVMYCKTREKVVSQLQATNQRRVNKQQKILIF